MMRTIFINHSESLSVAQNNPESKRYQEPNRRGRENGRKSAMSTALITCHYCKKTSHRVREHKKLERQCEMEKWCRYHQTNSHSDKNCYQQMVKSEISKMEGRINGVLAQ